MSDLNVPYGEFLVVNPVTKDANSKRIFCREHYLATVGNSDFELSRNTSIAQLMAASPDLYRALDNLLDIVMPVPERMPLSWQACIQEAKDALAKARGEI
jgi:hypothetical protein